MTKRMLIDASHAEETRVVVLDGSRLEDFDVETSTKRHLKGNIYLAKVVRVEPSLQAAFVEYGGNRHGFLAFSEIHPDYYQIPVADRQRLIEAQAEEARREEEEEDRAAEVAAAQDPTAHTELPEVTADEPAEAEAAEAESTGSWDSVGDSTVSSVPAEIVSEVVRGPLEEAAPPPAEEEPHSAEDEAPPVVLDESGHVEPEPEAVAAVEAEPDAVRGEVPRKVPADATVADQRDALVEAAEEATSEAGGIVETGDDSAAMSDVVPEQPPPETVGGDGDTTEETRERRVSSRFLRNYKIQEVIKRRQILLVQVVKEERGTKGAALTTYLSLAGRFCVLMPNSPRGGGISRKITSATDRRRLREIMAELEIPQGMGLIVRTAGANRPKAEIKRDCEYLLRLWDDIRDHTLKSVAPALIYEEASLIKRAIRDVYSRDIDEIIVDGEQGWRAAHEFMRMLMPSHAKKVQLWKNGGMPLFAKYQVDAQLDGMLLPIVQLRSGGYLVINQTEALVAIDVNSGRSTRERGIEETALRTNLEAADEVARQLRLRDLAGLIVIDFIDMETRKHNAMVEKRLKDALKNDRARIQVGHISHFGLMEMSRQRLRPSLAETSFVTCSHCGGTGHVRSTESAAIHVLRGIEEEGARRRAAEIVVYAAPQVALYILNHKRERLTDIEQRYGMHVLCVGDDVPMISQFRIERLRAQVASETPVAITQDAALRPTEIEADETAEPGEEDEEETESQADDSVPGETAEEAEHRRRRRRRRRSRGGARREEAVAAAAGEEVSEGEGPAAVEAHVEGAVEAHVEGVPEHAEAGEDGPRGRRRGRRGGRRRRHDENGEMPPHAEPGADQPDLPPVYSGPTPANPFGGNTFDIFDVLEQAEQAPPAAAGPAAAAEPEPAPSPSVILDEPEPAQALSSGAEPAPEIEELPPAQQAEEPASAGTGWSEPEAPPQPAQTPEPEPANDAAPEPAVKPIIIGSEQDVVVERKRGWWRR
ncbi:MAG TPA: Rne/Rng family ribonuclease [Acetobacteraceae bacterium]|nr:Rne/Rng family ribonuclease [Acetobacteraceae bacterium]